MIPKFLIYFQGQLWSWNSLYIFKVNCDLEILYIFSRSIVILKFLIYFQGQLWSRNSLYTFKVNCDPEILNILSRSIVIPKFLIYFQGQLWSLNSLYTFKILKFSKVDCDPKTEIHYMFLRSTVTSNPLYMCFQSQPWDSLYVFKVNCDPEILYMFSRSIVILKFLIYFQG